MSKQTAYPSNDMLTSIRRWMWEDGQRNWDATQDEGYAIDSLAVAATFQFGMEDASPAVHELLHSMAADVYRYISIDKSASR